MSIEVIVQHPSGAFRRHLNIHRVSAVHLDERHNDAVATYEVFLGKSSLTSPEPTWSNQAPTFEHRYGDDVLTLVAEAIDALGGRGGPSEECGGLSR